MTSPTQDHADRTEIDREQAVALVIAAGSSRRLGRPKQLLAYAGSTLLGVTLQTIRSFGFGTQMVTLGAAADQVRATTDLDGFDVIDSANPGSGCSSSIVTALTMVDAHAAGIVLFLGDQPHVCADAVTALLGAGSDAPVAVCRYDDGIGHPFWFSRDTFADLSALHGDKAVWKVIESGRWSVAEVPVDGAIPLDVDTEDDYARLLADSR